MLELASTIVVIVAMLASIFVIVGFVVLKFRERNLPPEEKERRRQLQYREVSKGDTRKTKYALLIVAISYIFVLGFILLDSWQGAQQKYDQQFESSEVPQVQQDLNQEAANEPIDTSTWQTYRNDEFGYEMKYPGDWIVEDTSNQYSKNRISFKEADKEYVLYSGAVMVSVYGGIEEFPGYTTDMANLLDFLNSGIEIVEPRKATFNGYSAYEACIGGHDLSYVVYIERSDGSIYTIFASPFCEKENIQRYRPMASAILSTFRFVE